MELIRPGSATSRRWVIGLVVGLLAVPTGLLAARLFLPSDGLPVVEPSGSVSDGSIRVMPPSPAAGIVEGDRVVAIAGVPVEDAFAQPKSRQLGAGDEIIYTVQRDGVTLDTMVTLGERRRLAPLAMDRAPIIIAMGAVFALAVWLFRRRPQEPAAHAFLLFAAALMSLQLTQLASIEPLDVFARPWIVAWYTLTLAAFLIMGFAALAFVSTFPTPTGRAGWWTSPQLCLIPIAATTLLSISYLLGWSSVDLYFAIDGIAGVVWLATVVTAVTVAVVRWRRTRTDPVARRQVQLVLLGIAGTFVPMILANIIPNDSSDLWFAVIILPFPVAVAAAIVRHDLFDLDVVLNRTLVLVTTTIVLLVVYGAVVMVAVVVTDSSSPWVAIPAAGVVAALASSVRERAQRWVDHRLFGFASDPAVVFHRLGARLSGVAEPDELMAAVVDSVTESLRLPYASIEIDNDGTRVSVEQRGRPSEVVEWFDLVTGEEIAGWLGVSPRRDLQALTAVDRALLLNLSSHLAVVVRLARVMNQLRAAQRQLIVAREDERHRLQRDLHDRIGPILVGMSLQLTVAAERAASIEQADLLTRLQHDASRATDDLRRLVRDLRPAELDEIGLPTAVEVAAARLGSADRLRFTVEIPLRLPEVTSDVENVIYQVCVEAMTNVVRHSGARHGSVRISPSIGGGLEVTIDDDGCGIDPTRLRGTGLTSMAERVDAVGGHLRIDADQPDGTHVHVSIPPVVVHA